MFYAYIMMIFGDSLAIFLKKNSKLLTIVTIIILGILFAFVPIDTSVIDTGIYKSYYDNPTWISGFEPGYILLSQIIRSFGVDYWGFRFIYGVIGLLIYSLSLARYKINQSYFFFLYGVLPFIEDAIQLRNFMMFALVMLGISFLIDFTLKNIFIFVILVILGAQFQTLAYFFLLIIPFRYFRDSKWFRPFFIFLLVSLTVIFVVPSVRMRIVNSVLLPLVNLFGRGTEISIYLTRIQPGKIIFADVIAHVLLISITARGTAYLIQNGLISDFENKVCVLVLDLMTAILIAVPFYLLAYNFDRVLKNSFSVFFIFVIIFLKAVLKYNLKAMLMYQGLILLFIFSYSIIYYTYGMRFEQVLIPVLFHNTFFSNSYST